MKIYLAGEGHTIIKTPFVKYLIKNGWNLLLSHGFMSTETTSKKRFDYIIQQVINKEK